MHSLYDAKKKTHHQVEKPGVDDKRLCIREGELASIFVLAGRPDSGADVVIRDAWDSKPLRNIVKGKSTDGFNNSAECQEPHISISGDTTRSELIRKLPPGADENGFGNRFIYCYVCRTKLCPQGSPTIDWSEEIPYFRSVIEFAKKQQKVGLAASAAKVWNRMYYEMENIRLPGMAGKMTSRGAAHVRRLALIYAMIDKSSIVESQHLRAAKGLWDYCLDSARYIFGGYTKEQFEILNFVEKRGKTTDKELYNDLYHRHKLVGWITLQVEDLTRNRYLRRAGGKYFEFVRK